MSKKFYKKTLVKNRLYGPDGKAVQFEVLRDNYGVLAVEENTPTDQFLAKCVAGGIGGVAVLTEAQYDELKKKLALIPGQPPKKRSQSNLQLAERVRLPSSKTPSKPQPQSPLPSLPDPAREYVRAAAERANAQAATANQSAAPAVGEGAGSPEIPSVDFFKPKTGSPDLPKPAE